VVIDNTSEQADGVPERFRRPQWTRLPGGIGNEDFRRRMVALVREYRRRAHD
jgi:broad specificity phosphatase PhoE